MSNESNVYDELVRWSVTGQIQIIRDSMKTVNNFIKKIIVLTHISSLDLMEYVMTMCVLIQQCTCLIN